MDDSTQNPMPSMSPAPADDSGAAAPMNGQDVADAAADMVKSDPAMNPDVVSSMPANDMPAPAADPAPVPEAPAEPAGDMPAADPAPVPADDAPAAMGSPAMPPADAGAMPSSDQTPPAAPAA